MLWVQRRSEVTTDACHRLPLIIALPLLPFQSKAFKQLRDASIKCLAGDTINQHHVTMTSWCMSVLKMMHYFCHTLPGLPAHLGHSPWALTKFWAPSRTCFEAKSVRDPRKHKAAHLRRTQNHSLLIREADEGSEGSASAETNGNNQMLQMPIAKLFPWACQFGCSCNVKYDEILYLLRILLVGLGHLSQLRWSYWLRMHEFQGCWWIQKPESSLTLYNQLHCPHGQVHESSWIAILVQGKGTSRRKCWREANCV